MQTTAALSTSTLKKAIDRYYKQLQDYKGRADYELAVRTAFLNLLNETAHQVKWMLIPEQMYIVRLVGRVVTVSVETVRLVDELAQAVKMEDWMGEKVERN